MAQTVYVLGAGASYGDALTIYDESHWRSHFSNLPGDTEVRPATPTNPPLINGFFDAKYLWWNSLELIERFNPELMKYIRRRWRINGAFGTEDWLNLNLEDIFTSVAIDVEFNPTGTDAHAKSQLLLNQTKRHVSFVLGSCTIFRYGEHCRALVRALHESDTIINFNYDLLIDQELTPPHAGAYQYHNFADVVLDKPFNDENRSKALRNMDTGSGLYLKMHGSLNWTTCTNTSCPRSITIEIGDVVTSLLLRNSPTGGPPRCETCKGEVSTVLVPPLLNKPVMHSPVFRNIWSNALYSLRQAQRIVIIGYSFPPTDFYAEWLFRSAGIDEDTPVRIVNPLNDPAHPDQEGQIRFVKRMESIFPRGYDNRFTRFDQFPFD